MKRSLKILISFLFSFSLLTEAYSQYTSRQQVQLRRTTRNAQSYRFEFEISYKFSVPGETRMIQMLVLMPKNIADRQRILNIKSTPGPVRIVRRNGNTYAEYLFTNPDEEINIDISIEALLYRYDLSTATRNPRLTGLSRSERANFLKQEKHIEKDSPAIQKVAQQITGKTDIEIVKSIYDFVINNMEYVKLSGRELGAVQALREGKGDCTEYSDLFVAICRAREIPARVITGYVTANNSNLLRHSWAEVYLQDYGWIPFELSGADVPSASLRNMAFSNMMSQYMYFSHIRNDETLDNYDLCVYRYWGRRAKLTDTVKYRRLPPVASR